MNYKKNLTEIREFFEFYYKIITPLLVDCWLEAKPENKRRSFSNFLMNSKYFF